MNSFLKKSIILTSLCLSGLLVFNSCQKDAPIPRQSERPGNQQVDKELKFQTNELKEANIADDNQLASKTVSGSIFQFQIKEPPASPLIISGKGEFINDQGYKVTLVKTGADKVTVTINNPLVKRPVSYNVSGAAVTTMSRSWWKTLVDFAFGALKIPSGGCTKTTTSTVVEGGKTTTTTTVEPTPCAT